MIERRPYQDRPPRHEYVLTEQGGELMMVLLAMLSWGDRWTAGEDGPPMFLRHKGCKELVEARVTCSCCGEPLRADEVRLEPGPGLRIRRGTTPLPERHPLYELSVQFAKSLEGRSLPASRPSARGGGRTSSRVHSPMPASSSASPEPRERRDEWRCGCG